jgi:hypothetical protein
MSIWGNVISAGASLLGSAAEYKGQSSANSTNMDIMREQQNWNRGERIASQDWNKEQRIEIQNWNKMMSDTAHTREVKDMREAGLNPVLSATGGRGASSAMSSSASSSPTSTNSAKAENKMQGQRIAAINMAEAVQRIQVMKSQAKKIEAEATSAKAESVMNVNRTDYYQKHPWVWKFNVLKDALWNGPARDISQGAAGIYGAKKIGGMAKKL